MSRGKELLEPIVLKSASGFTQHVSVKLVRVPRSTLPLPLRATPPLCPSPADALLLKARSLVSGVGFATATVSAPGAAPLMRVSVSVIEPSKTRNTRLPAHSAGTLNVCRYSPYSVVLMLPYS